MINRYSKVVFDATNKLIQAVSDNDLIKATNAFNEGADVNCRIVKAGNGYQLASDEALTKTLSNRTRAIYCRSFRPSIELDYIVPMVGTTTLLNVLSWSSQRAFNKALASLLLDNGADLGAIDYASFWEFWGNSAQNYFQNTPLLNAIAANNLDFANLYITYLSKLEIAKRKAILDYKDKFGAGFHTALEFAIRRGFYGLATDLVRAGANPNPIPFFFSYAGKSPLHMACMSLGYSYLPLPKGIWHPKLGSGLELVLALLEHGAEFKLTAQTDIYKERAASGTLQWHTMLLTAFDHLELTYEAGQTRLIDVGESCQAPAYEPKKVGQIKHPFEEEDSFLTLFADNLRKLSTRPKYLSSEQFKQVDKIILQKALLKRILIDFEKNFPNQTFNVTDFEVQQVENVVNSMLNHAEHQWFQEQLEYASLIYKADKQPYLPEAFQLTPEILRAHAANHSNITLDMIIVDSPNSNFFLSNSSLDTQPNNTNSSSTPAILNEHGPLSHNTVVEQNIIAVEKSICEQNQADDVQSDMVTVDFPNSNFFLSNSLLGTQPNNTNSSSTPAILNEHGPLSHSTVVEQNIVAVEESICDQNRANEVQSDQSLRGRLIQATNNYLQWCDENASDHRLLTRFSHWYHGTSGRVRAQILLDALKQPEVTTDTVFAIISAFKTSGHRQHSLSRYLWEAFYPNEPVIDNHTNDGVFALLKQKREVQLQQDLNAEVSNTTNVLGC